MTERWRRRWPLLALLTFCAGADIAAETPPSVDAILSGATNDGGYAKTQRCLRTDMISRTRVLNDRYIVFETGRSQRWLAKLGQACPMLRPDSKLQFDVRDPRLCQWDAVRVLLDNGPGRFPTPGPPCQMPEFQEVTQQQVDALREALKVRAPS
jgi:hypothetical protein